MNEGPGSNRPPRWGSARDLVVAAFGADIPSYAESIKAYARRGDKGLDAMPPELVQRSADGAVRYLISDDSITFARNVIELEALVPPRVVAKIVKSEYRDAPTELRRELAKASEELRRQYEVAARWVLALPGLEARLLDPDLDLMAVPLLGTTVRDPDERAVTQVGARMSLAVMKRLKELDRSSHDADEIRAERALLLLSIGETHAAKLELEGGNESPRVLYAHALVLLRSAAEAVREGRYFALMAEEAGLQHEAHYESLAEDAHISAATLRRRAFERLALAYRDWPRQTWGASTFYVDSMTRERVAGTLLDLAFGFAHDHHSADMNDVLNLGRRRRGEPVETYFGHELDPIVAEVARAAERRGFVAMTKALQIHFACSLTDYTRLAPLWVEDFGRSSASSIVAALVPQYQHNALAQVAREHLQRLRAGDARGAAVGVLVRRYRDESEALAGKLASFLIDDPVSSDDDFDVFE